MSGKMLPPSAVLLVLLRPARGLRKPRSSNGKPLAQACSNAAKHSVVCAKAPLRASCTMRVLRLGAMSRRRLLPTADWMISSSLHLMSVECTWPHPPVQINQTLPTRATLSASPAHTATPEGNTPSSDQQEAASYTCTLPVTHVPCWIHMYPATGRKGIRISNAAHLLNDPNHFETAVSHGRKSK